MSLLTSASRQAKRVEQAHFLCRNVFLANLGRRGLWLAWLLGFTGVCGLRCGHQLRLASAK